MGQRSRFYGKFPPIVKISVAYGNIEVAESNSDVRLLIR